MIPSTVPRSNIDDIEDDIEDYDDDFETKIFRSINDEVLRGNTSTGFYYNPTQSFYNYKTAYLNALLLLGIFQTPQDLKPLPSEHHPIQTIIRHANKFGLSLKIVPDVKCSACSSGILLCKSNKIWYAIDVTNKKRVDSLTGEIIWTITSNIDLIYKIEPRI